MIYQFYLLIPFLGILLSISIMPLLLRKFWHKHENKILIFWSVVSGILSFSLLPKDKAISSYLEIICHEYIPFISITFPLFVLAGGVFIRLKGEGTPFQNTRLLMMASFFSSFIGTTGASMLFIRPLLQLNQHRHYKVHIVIFFIFLVSNISGALTPLGDPPLFLGYLLGISFFWPLLNMWAPFLFSYVFLLIIFYSLDSFFYRKEVNLHIKENIHKNKENLKIKGKINIALITLLIVFVLLTSSINDFVIFEIYNVQFKKLDFIRVIVFLLLGIISYFMTPKSIHKDNDFTFSPYLEVVRVFLAIFITMTPVALMLKNGKGSIFSPLLHFVSQQNSQAIYFWLSGIFSAFLDNAPTYLVFFKLTGSTPAELMTTNKNILVSISLGSVFMGALTYIGNAPNFMVRSIAGRYGVKMPSFIGYTWWSLSILIPLFIIMSWIWL